MSINLTYNADLMDEISKNYKSCADKAQETIDELNNAQNLFEASYEGQGCDMAQTVYAKIAEHLVFLRSCLDQTGQYVTYTKEIMQELDSKIK